MARPLPLQALFGECIPCYLQKDVVYLSKLEKIFSVVIALVGVIFVISAFLSEGISFWFRTRDFLLGIVLLAASTISVIRWALLSISSLCIAISVITSHVSANNTLSVGYFIVFLTCAIIAVCFGFKVIQQCLKPRHSRFLLSDVDNMTGLQFEQFTADLLSRIGYTNVSVTKASGDQGVDIIAYRDGFSYAIQCKHYSSPLGNSSVQEVYSGKAFYGCDYAAVITNSYFTSGAQQLALSIGVMLWDRTSLQAMITQANRPRTFHVFGSKNHRSDVASTSLPNGIGDVSSDCSPVSSVDIDEASYSIPKTSKRESVTIDESFIAEAQWYAARGGEDLIDDE